MDFNLSKNSITPVDNDTLNINGTKGIVMPGGTTIERPASPANGTIRYNSDTGNIESYFSSTWVDWMLSIQNQLVVQKNPGVGEFSSIADAVASITGATESSPWCIMVYPGDYEEPEITIPSFVNITGITQYAVQVMPLTSTQNLFVMNETTSLNFIQLTGIGSGYAGIVAHDVGNYALCHKVSMVDCDIGWDIKSDAVDSIVYLEYCDTTGGNEAIKIESTNGSTMYSNFENFYIFASDAGVNPTTGLSVIGTDATVFLHVFGIEGADGAGSGISVSDGASFTANAGHVYGWDIGCHADNVGDAPYISFLAAEIQANTTWDVYAQHPGTTGSISGTMRREFVNVVDAPTLTLAFSDPAANSFVQTGTFYMGPTGSELTDVSSLIIDTPTIGLLDGGVMSLAGGLNVGISAGTGYLRKSGLVTKITWSSGTIAITAGTTPYVYIDSDGVFQKAVSIPDTLTNILLGRVGANGSAVYTLGPLSINISNYGNKVEDWLRQTVGPVFVSGSIVTENSGTARAIDVSSGHWYYGTQQRFPSSKTVPNIVDVYHVSGVLTFSVITQLPNNTYDNGTNLVSVTSGYYIKHVIYQSSEGAFQSYQLAHAQAEYATLDECRAAPLPFPLIDPGPTPKISASIMQEGNANVVEFIDVRPMFFNSSGTGTSGTNIHGDLLGLGANDHPQYLLVDGTSAMTGDLDLDSNDIISVGTVNGVTVETHASRHLPNGADPLTTATAVGLSASSTNTTGTANSLSRSDHTHSISGVQPVDATLTALAAYNTNGFLVQTTTDTFTGRTITGTTNRISLTNGDGVSGNPAIDISSSYVGQTSITTLGTISTGTWSATTIAVTRGGTGLSSYAIGDILYADSTTTLDTLADVATGNALISGGINAAPLWGKIALTTHVSGTLPIANGGTNMSSVGTANQILSTNVGATALEYRTVSGSNGVSISPSAGTLAIGLGAITPTSVAASGTVTGSNLSGSSSGTNTGDQTITLTGDVTGTGTGSFATTLATANASPQTDTFRKITVNGKGLVTATSVVASGDITTALGYTPYNATNPAGYTTNVGTVTSVSVTTANGVSGSVATSTVTPAITLTLGAITPTSVAASGTVTGSNLSGTNTGNQTITLTGDVTGSGTGSFAATLATVNVSPQTDTFRKITVSGKGLVTATSAVGSSDITTALGYTPYDATNPNGYTNNTGTVTSVAIAGGTTGLSTTGGPITTSGTITLTGTLAIANGGTGQTTASAAFNALSPLTTTGDIIYANGTSSNTRLAGNTTVVRNFLRQVGNGSISAAPAWDTVTKTDVGLSAVENTALSTWAGTTNITTLGTISAGTWSATTIATNKGGTGQTTYAVGDILYADTTSTLSKLADVATGNSLISGGTNTAPSWGKIGLTTHVSGTLPIANGGTNLTSLGTANQIVGVNAGATALEYKTVTAGAGITVANAANSITITGKVLQVVTGSIAASTGTTQIVTALTASPTTSDGFQIWTTSFTPLSAASKLLIQFTTVSSHGTAGRTIIYSCFAGTTNLGSAAITMATSNAPYPLPFQAVYAPGSVSTITISARAGATASGTLSIGQFSGTTNTLGGAAVSEYIIMEVL